MRHTCDETCIHTIAAKIVNRAYPIDAVSSSGYPLTSGTLKELVYLRERATELEEE
jgi:hypothetical protein